MAKNGTRTTPDGFIQKYKCKCGYTSQDQITGRDKKQVQEMWQTCKKWERCDKENSTTISNGGWFNITINREHIDSIIIDAQDEIIEEQITKNKKQKKCIIALAVALAIATVALVFNLFVQNAV